MAFNPNAVFISPSSLADFGKCPQLYFFRNVYRTPRDLKIQLINPALALGQTVHDTIEHYVGLPPLLRTKDALLSSFTGIWTQLSGDKGGFTDPLQEEDYRRRAAAMLDRFAAHTHFQTAVKYKTPSFPKLDLGPDLILTGKLDWLEKNGDTFRIVDFKTGKNEEKESSQQLPIYAVLVSGLVASDQIVASYWYLDKDPDLLDFPLPPLAQTLSSLKRQGEIIQLARQTKSFRCQSGGTNCWACRDMQAIANGRGKLVTIDTPRKQEIYILPKDTPVPETSDLPF